MARPRKRKSPKKRKASTRARFKKATDAQRQLHEIEDEQTRSRAGQSPAIIDSIEKSRQRFRNSLDNIRSLDDAYEQFDA